MKKRRKMGLCCFFNIWLTSESTGSKQIQRKPRYCTITYNRSCESISLVSKMYKGGLKALCYPSLHLMAKMHTPWSLSTWDLDLAQIDCRYRCHVPCGAVGSHPDVAANASKKNSAFPVSLLFRARILHQEQLRRAKRTSPPFGNTLSSVRLLSEPLSKELELGEVINRQEANAPQWCVLTLAIDGLLTSSIARPSMC